MMLMQITESVLSAVLSRSLEVAVTVVRQLDVCSIVTCRALLLKLMHDAESDSGAENFFLALSRGRMITFRRERSYGTVRG